MTFSLAKNGVRWGSISISAQFLPLPTYLYSYLGSSCAGARRSDWVRDQWWIHALPGAFSFLRYSKPSRFTNVYQRDLPVIAKRKLHIIGGARGLWSLPIRQPVRAGGITYEKPMNPFHAEMDTLIMSTDVNPSPGFSRV
jgi:hypothetical protein